MLSISPIRNVGYYIDIAKEDYYQKGDEPPGIWGGSASRLLGLSGEVNATDYQNIMDGIHPTDFSELRQQQSTKARNGWDCTFSAPKSVSLAWARADGDLRAAIQNSHSEAVKEAIKFLEDHAGFTRRDSGGIRRERTNGFVVATFEHSTSRAQDPQLHTHSLIANVAPRSDGSWGSLDSHYLYQWHRAAGAIYRSHLANELEKHHFTIERDEHSFHLSEIPKSICDIYSKRSTEIAKHLDELGIHATSNSRNVAALSSRKNKENLSRNELFSNWEQEFDDLSFSRHGLDLKLMENKRLVKSGLGELFRDDTIKFHEVEAQLLETKSTFREQDLYKVIAELGQTKRKDRQNIEAAAKNFLESEEILELQSESAKERVFTTKSMIELERSVIRKTRKLSRLETKITEKTLIEQTISSDYSHLSEEQKEAIFSTCLSGDFAIMQGSAGVGKTISLECVRDIYNKNGIRVFGASLAKTAADNLQQESGIESFTIDKILTEFENGKAIWPKNSVLIIDESSQVSISKLNALLELAHQNELKLILVGDEKQLDSIEHGGALRFLSNSAVLGATRVETIRRQREDWAKRAVASFRDGNAKAALTEMDKRDLIHFAKSSQETKQQLVTGWNQYNELNPHKQSIMLAQRWSDVNDLNQLARDERRLFGRIEKDEYSLKCVVGKKQFDLNFAVGDEIRLTKNDYRLNLTNGERGKIKNISRLFDNQLVITFENTSGEEKTIDTSKYCDLEQKVYMVHGYAMTIYSSQGLTVDGDSFVYYSTGMDRANSYVACSRHKDKCHLFVNKKEVVELTQATNNIELSNQNALAFMSKLMGNEKLNTLAHELKCSKHKHQSKSGIELDFEK